MDSKYKEVEKLNSSYNGNGNLNGFPAKRSPIAGNFNDKSAKKLKIHNESVNFGDKSNSNNGESSNGRPLHTLSIQEQRQRLPAYQCRQRIITEFKKANTLLLLGETGSGKTTQIPEFLHEAAFTQRGMIAITQPRRVAAITVAKRVSQEMGSKLGETVGFRVRFEDCSSRSTKILYMTDGSLLREALSDRLLKNYSVIMLDEVHERTVNTDVLFGIVKEAQYQRKAKNLFPLKIIATSATMDVDHFAQYFGVNAVYLEGKTYPVRIFHIRNAHNDYLEACICTLFEIHRNAPANEDVLMFLTGQEEIETMAQQIRQIVRTNDLNAPIMRVFPLYSQLPQNKQLECFIPSGHNSRKVVLATNIAETSITVPGIKYVIDCGYVKRRTYDPSTGMESLKNVRISQAQSWQRCGRAGRDSEGFCYRTYTQDELDAFEKMTVPEILRCNISSIAIQLLALGINCQTFDFLDKPPVSAIEDAYKQLQLLGAIKTINSPELTTVGRKMALFPLDPRYSKLLLSAPDFNCLEEILSIVAILSGENIFITPTDKRDQAALAHAKFESKYGDHLTLLNVFKAFQNTEKIRLWCHDNFLNPRNLLYAKNVRNQLQEICEMCGLAVKSCGTNYDQVRKCLLVGLFNNVAELQRDNFYLTLSSRHRAKIHPSSVLSGKSRPKCILYTELVCTEKNYLRIITEIDIEWLEEVVPNFPYLNRRNTTKSFS